MNNSDITYQAGPLSPAVAASAVATRLTKAERAVVDKVRLNARRPVFKRSGRTWTFADVPGLCTAAQLDLHADAEKYWNKQTAHPKSRKIRLEDGREVLLSNIRSGNTSGIPTTAEQKKDANAQRSATYKARHDGSQHYKEAIAIRAVGIMLETQFPGKFIIETLPDGLGADALIRHTDGLEDAFAAVQFKSAIAHPEQGMNLHVKRVDGDCGGKYEHMILVCVGLKICERPDGAVFDTVSEGSITDLFVYENASKMPGASLNPYPRRVRNQDSFGLNRYSASVDEAEDLERMLGMFAQYITAAPKFTRSDAWFGTVLNKMQNKHSVEIGNGRALADVLGGLCLSAPFMQNETVDVIVTIDNLTSRVSFKTASRDKSGGFFFNKGVAPNDQFCEIVMMFYIDRKSEEQTRTHLSIISARDVYGDGVDKTFCWSKTNKPHILNDRISMLQGKDIAKLAITETLRTMMI